MGDEALYLEATAEIESGNREPAIWAKAVALAQGNNEKAKYKYIYLRVQQLKEARAEREPAKAGNGIHSLYPDFIPVKEFAAWKKGSEATVIEMIRSGLLDGLIIRGEWLVRKTVEELAGDPSEIVAEGKQVSAASISRDNSSQTPPISPLSAPDPTHRKDPTHEEKFVASKDQQLKPNKADLLGTKWLKLWTYFSLPVSGVLAFLYGLAFPSSALLFNIAAIFFFVLAAGLHSRAMWAWHWNWVAIGLSWINAAIPVSAGSQEEAIAKFLLFLPMFGILWMLPNYIYWKKRKPLFIGSSGLWLRASI